MNVNPRPKPPLPGGEYVHISDPGTPPLPPGVKRYNLIPVGDGGPGPLIPPGRRKSRKPLLPSEAEIATLPKWARVAYAVRCAKRVLPVIPMGSLPERKHDAIRDAIVFAESEAKSATAEETLEIATRVYAVLSSDDSLAVSAQHAIRAIALAADAVYFTLLDPGLSARYSLRAASDATSAIVRVSDDAGDLKCFRRDFERFAYLAKREKWTDETPVSPDAVGKLWPAGRTPDWARQEAEANS